MVHAPALLLADEPTGNLHSTQGREIMELFRELNRQGTTIVQVTHSEENARYGSRIVELRDGWITRDEKLKPKSTGGWRAVTFPGKDFMNRQTAPSSVRASVSLPQSCSYRSTWRLPLNRRLRNLRREPTQATAASPGSSNAADSSSAAAPPSLAQEMQQAQQPVRHRSSRFT